MAKSKKNISNENNFFCEEIRFKMAKSLAEGILNSRKDSEKKVDNQKYLCDFVNNELGLKGHCVEVVIS